MHIYYNKLAIDKVGIAVSISTMKPHKKATFIAQISSTMPINEIYWRK